jgi:hypothetical protein
MIEFFKPDAKNIEMLSSLAPHYVEVHSYNKTVAGFNATLAAFLIGAQANAFWNLGPGAWQCDDWDVRAHYSTAAIFISLVVCRRVAGLLKRKFDRWTLCVSRCGMLSMTRRLVHRCRTQRWMGPSTHESLPAVRPRKESPLGSISSSSCFLAFLRCLFPL